MANKYNRCIASNFPFKINALWEYLIFRKYWNLCQKLIEGKFFYFNPYGENKDSILGLISVKNSEIFFDEVPQFLSSRRSSRNPDKIINRLSQVRKKKSDLLYASQDWMSVDSELRRQTHYVINCEGVLIPNLEGYPRLVSKDVSIHTKHAYEKWYQHTNRDRFLFRRKHQLKRWTKPVVCHDLLLFELYDSTLDLGENLEGKLPQEYHKIYFAEILDPELGNYCFSKIENYYECFRIQSSHPPQNLRLNLEKQSCLVPNKLKFYWDFVSSFPATFFPIVLKIPDLLKLPNNWAEWKGEYKKIW